MAEVWASSTQETTIPGPDHLLPNDCGAMDTLIQDHSKDGHVHFSEDTYDIFRSWNTTTHFSIKKSGLGLTEPPKDESWHSVVRMELAENKLCDLPSSPSSPVLEVLMLQGNVDLTRIPSTFFLKMPLLKILDLSYTSLRELPDSLFDLEQLTQLYLKGCERFMKLSPKIGKLKRLEKLDLNGTQIIHLPEEIQELANLQSLFLCFYEYRGRKGKQYTCSTIIPSEVISKLKELKHLSIDVNPDDERWHENVQDILPEILGLEHLLTLSLYLPDVELLKFIPNRILQVDFRFTVGRHMQRIISSTPSSCEAKFKQSGCSVKFVNGDVVSNEIKRLVGHSKALFLERHKTIKNLSEFEMMNLEQLRLCMLAECREMETFVDGRKSNMGNDIFSHLLYLYISHMKSLRSIWEGPVPPRCFLGMLKSLVLQNCPELTTVFTMDFLGNLSLLKELIVKDCPKVTTLISDGSFKHTGEVFLPKLRKMKLLHLPRLITISNGCYIGPSLNKMAIYDCPKLKSLSKLELSSQTLEVIKGEIKWWDQLQWSKEEWGISKRPSEFDSIFSSIDNQVDLMTQLWIDADADAILPQPLFECPRQNADKISSAKQNANKSVFKVSSEVDIVDDGYKWRKYGQKTMFGSKNPRHNYKCAYEGCQVKKKVQKSEEDPTKIEFIYTGTHEHNFPQYNRSLHEPQSMGMDPVDVMTEFDEDDIDEKVGTVEHPLRPSKRGHYRKRRVSPTWTKQSESIEDGYSWRKYGQKDVGAKFPRLYFRCTHKFDQGCQATKQVQREDKEPFFYLTTYYGHHTCTRTSINNQIDSSTQSGVQDDDDVHNPPVKSTVLRPSGVRTITDQRQISNRRRWRGDTSSQASRVTDPTIIYSPNQSVVNAFKNSLQKVEEQSGEIAICTTNTEDAGDLNSLKWKMICKACKVKEVCVLLLPCRHLCLCKDCNVFIDLCPVCGTRRTASVQVIM